MTDVTTLAAKILSDALGLEARNIAADTRLGFTPEWDSLAHMRIILALEKHNSSQLAPEAILSIAGFDDVVKILESS